MTDRETVQVLFQVGGEEDEELIEINPDLAFSDLVQQSQLLDGRDLREYELTTTGEDGKTVHLQPNDRVGDHITRPKQAVTALVHDPVA